MIDLYHSIKVWAVGQLRGRRIDWAFMHYHLEDNEGRYWPDGLDWAYRQEIKRIG